MPPPPEIFHSRNEHETAALAQQIAHTLSAGQYISLEGDLGAGKTLFTRHLLQALGVTDSVTSPTYVIQKLYPLANSSGAIRLIIHYDLYRIQHPDELIDLGFEDHDDQTLVLVEWGNLHPHSFPQPPIRIIISILPNDNRTIEIHRPHESRPWDQLAQ